MNYDYEYDATMQATINMNFIQLRYLNGFQLYLNYLVIAIRRVECMEMGELKKTQTRAMSTQHEYKFALADADRRFCTYFFRLAFR